MLPTEKELTEFIKRKDNLVNFSMIAKQFDIKNATASDLVELLQKKKLVSVKKIGGQKLVMVKK